MLIVLFSTDKMEILDPRTKSCTFLTLRDYNGIHDTRRRAQCIIEKSEAFMTPQNLYVAAESFKVSLQPNPDGLVYKTVPNYCASSVLAIRT